ncbi:MAG: hypothetical protein ACRCTY_05845, partial [Candidatus Adiutrix sp.]
MNFDQKPNEGPPTGGSPDHQGANQPQVGLGPKDETVPFWEIFANTSALLRTNFSAVINYVVFCFALSCVPLLVNFLANSPSNSFVSFYIQTLVLLFFIIPIILMGASRLSLKFWDNEETHWGDIVYGLSNYKDSLLIFASWAFFAVLVALITWACLLGPQLIALVASTNQGSIAFVLTIFGLALFVFLA